jgi:hypothetical protein
MQEPAICVSLAHHKLPESFKTLDKQCEWDSMAQRMGASTRTVPASHASLVSHPKEVAEIIALAAAAQHVGSASN